MKRIAFNTNFALALAFAGMLAGGQAIADKPPWAGGGKGEKGGHMEKPENQQGRRLDGDDRSSRDNARVPVKMGEHFGDRHRTLVHDYYSDEFRRGHCPPGLAKKHNGCMPPGQARKWSAGRPLPRDVIYYNLPPALVGQFDQPPAGYRYVRVASDILLIALGTGTVVDAIQNLGRI